MNAPIAAADWPRLLDLVEQALDVPELERELWLRRLHLPLALVRQVLPALERSLGGDAPHVLRARLLLHLLQKPGGYRPGAWDGSLIFFS